MFDCLTLSISVGCLAIEIASRSLRDKLTLSGDVVSGTDEVLALGIWREGTAVDVVCLFKGVDSLRAAGLCVEGDLTELGELCALTDLLSLEIDFLLVIGAVSGAGQSDTNWS